MKGSNKDSQNKERELVDLALGSSITTTDPKICESKGPAADEADHLRYVYFPFLILAQVLSCSTILELMRWNERGFTRGSPVIKPVLGLWSEFLHGDGGYSTIEHTFTQIRSDAMLYPPHDCLVGSSLASKFCPDTIYMILEDLTPNNLRIFRESKNFKGHTDMVESWYQNEFSIEKITDAIV
ncbi:hypothetical protein EJ110_NYTH54506 [Nymphaea thermarum]|nr:hypothetical protein EJ110_NYTH54506 [Nymphaea thermarum]